MARSDIVSEPRFALEIADFLARFQAADRELRAWQAEEKAKAAARWREVEPLIGKLRERAAEGIGDDTLSALSQAGGAP